MTVERLEEDETRAGNQAGAASGKVMVEKLCQGRREVRALLERFVDRGERALAIHTASPSPPPWRGGTSTTQDCAVHAHS